jgi:hypothetical protein
MVELAETLPRWSASKSCPLVDLVETRRPLVEPLEPLGGGVSRPTRSFR